MTPNELKTIVDLLVEEGCGECLLGDIMDITGQIRFSRSAIIKGARMCFFACINMKGDSSFLSVYTTDLKPLKLEELPSEYGNIITDSEYRKEFCAFLKENFR